MMQPWVILWITVLAGPFEGISSGIPYQSMAQCEAATRAISDAIKVDHRLTCAPTSFGVATVRPKRNPIHD